MRWPIGIRKLELGEEENRTCFAAGLPLVARSAAPLATACSQYWPPPLAATRCRRRRWLLLAVAAAPGRWPLLAAAGRRR